MVDRDKRYLVYTALLILCAASTAFTGVTGALGSFVQVAVVIELLRWLGRRAGGTGCAQCRLVRT
jgi:hypothetical protein